MKIDWINRYYVRIGSYELFVSPAGDRYDWICQVALGLTLYKRGSKPTLEAAKSAAISAMNNHKQGLSK